MKSREIGLNRLAGCLAAGICSISRATASFGQAPAGAGKPPIISIKRAEHGRQAAEAKLRSAEMDAGEEAENQKRILTAIANMKEDFTRIQVLRNDIVRNLVARKPLDYSLVRDQTAEINRRTHRLNVYMLAHPPDKKEPDTTSDLKSEEMVGALVKLCKLIDRFTENPALKSAATIDAEKSEQAKADKAKADADLLAIIKLSEAIQKKAGDLRAPE